MKELVVPDSLDGGRLDLVLHDLDPELSRRVARRLVESGGVRRAGVRAGARERVRAGETLAYFPEFAATTIALGIGVLHEDEDVLVLHKPPGRAVHAGPLVTESVAERLGKVFPGAGLAHRLDRLASGLLLVGKNAEALRLLSRAMEQGRIERVYRAIVLGLLDGDVTIDTPLRVTDEPRGDEPKVVPDPAGLPARTHLRVVERLGDLTHVEIRIETGRTHQIRAHLRAIGHPLLGDPRYGDPEANSRAHETFGVARPLLHAWRLAFDHPRTGARVSFEAALEPDFDRLLRGASRSRGPDPRA